MNPSPGKFAPRLHSFQPAGPHRPALIAVRRGLQGRRRHLGRRPAARGLEGSGSPRRQGLPRLRLVLAPRT